MRFLVLLAEEDHFARWEAADAARREAVFEALAGFSEAVRQRGTVLAGEGLAAPDRAVTLRDGVPTQGPYAESAEQLGGFYLVDLPTLDDALNLAAPMSRLVDVEIRPVVSE